MRHTSKSAVTTVEEVIGTAKHLGKSAETIRTIRIDTAKLDEAVGKAAKAAKPVCDFLEALAMLVAPDKPKAGESQHEEDQTEDDEKTDGQ